MNYPTLGQILELYDEVVTVSGGSYGLRDLGYLESALYQPQQTFTGTDLYPTLSQKAAALGYSLIMNHPFVDGNKRIGLVAMEFFLELNGMMLSVSVDETVETILQVAKGEFSREALTNWIENHLTTIQPL